MSEGISSLKSTKSCNLLVYSLQERNIEKKKKRKKKKMRNEGFELTHGSL